MAGVPEPILYYRDNCHLCETMLQALRGLQLRLAFDLQLMDVDRDPELAQRYGEWVPVLCLGEREICHYYLDEPVLRQFLEQLLG